MIDFKKLYEYSGKNIDQVKWSRQVKSTIEDQGDRSLALVSCSVLDLQLQNLLKAFFIEDKKVDDDLFKNQMPLSSFSSKITMCYYLGLISEYEKNMINLMRKIRNKFAHEIDITYFNDSEKIKGWCGSLTIPDKMYVPEKLKIDEEGNLLPFDINPFPDNSLRTRYMTVFSFISMCLYDREELDGLSSKRVKCVMQSPVDRMKRGLEEVEKQQEKYRLLLERILFESKQVYDKVCEEERNAQKNISGGKADKENNDKMLEGIKNKKRKIEEHIKEIESFLGEDNDENSGWSEELGCTYEEYKKMYLEVIAVIEKSYEE